MSAIDTKDIALLLVGFALSIIGALVGAHVQRRLDNTVAQRPLNQLLNFGDDAILFVFPHRDEVPEALLPRTSTEDFLAMNNFISALLQINWNKNVAVRDTRHVSAEDRKRNLIVICSPKSNSLAGVLQAELIAAGKAPFRFNRKDSGEWTICDDTVRDSPSFEQERLYRAQGILQRDMAEQTFTDYAIVSKVTNPWNPSNRIVWLAGIRGIGTWGAGECEA